jgi:hypothetical protein
MHVQIHQLAGGIMFSFRFVMIQSDPTTTRVTVAAIHARRIHARINIVRSHSFAIPLTGGWTCVEGGCD